MKKIIFPAVFLIGYVLITGTLDSHFWFPFIIVTVVSMGWEKTKLWKDGEGSKKFKDIVGLKNNQEKDLKE